MIGKVIAKLGAAVLPWVLKALLRAVPVERVVAWALNWLLGKIDAGNIERARVSARHLAQLADVFADALEDHRLTEAEIVGAAGRYAVARRALIDEWARGKSAKPLERVLNGADIIAGRQTAAETGALLAADIRGT